MFLETSVYMKEFLIIAIFVGLLFCLFQIPYIKKIMQTNLAFLYKNDGNLTSTGYIITSMLFGSLYYITLKVLDIINS